MPFAISFVGAGIIWKLMYDYRQGEQIGLLNAIVVAFGGEPVSWLAVEPLVNTFCLLVVFIWSQTGLAMVILSAAVKAVPVEQMEAAELDGTNAWQRFRNVTLPGIRIIDRRRRHDHRDRRAQDLRRRRGHDRRPVELDGARASRWSTSSSGSRATGTAAALAVVLSSSSSCRSSCST